MSEQKKYSKMDQIPDGRAQGPITQGCIVIEGGAFRGIYNQGVLDALMLNDINIHTVIGVSAGALAGVNYVTGQIGRSARVNLGYRNDSRYVGARAFKSGHSILNLDFLFETYDEIEPLDREKLASDERHFIAVATNCITGTPAYYDKDNCTNVLDAVKASASMPYISPMVEVDGVPCLDGGCSCKIPFRWALDHDFEKIVVVKTQDRSYRKSMRKRPPVNKLYHKFEALSQSLASSDDDYNRDCDEIDALEAQGRIYVIAPEEPVTVGGLERDVEKLGDLYWEGYNETMDQLEAIRKYLSDTH